MATALTLLPQKINREAFEMQDFSKSDASLLVVMAKLVAIFKQLNLQSSQQNSQEIRTLKKEVKQLNKDLSDKTSTSGYLSLGTSAAYIIVALASAKLGADNATAARSMIEPFSAFTKSFPEAKKDIIGGTARIESAQLESKVNKPADNDQALDEALRAQSEVLKAATR